jgi:hypothetical protein
MLITICKQSQPLSTVTEEDEDALAVEKLRKRDAVRKKILAIGKMARMFSTLRYERRSVNAGD